MENQNISEERLNLFIDEQLDAEDMDAIHKAVLEDASLRERVCQLKAVRELVGYAYSEVPPSRYESEQSKLSRPGFYRAIAASILVFIGVLLGWTTYGYTPNAVKAVSAENAFQYVANRVTVDHQQRKIVLHIDSGDIKVVNAALDEADQLLATYRRANTQMKLDVVTNKGGINILREDFSPYMARIQKLIEEDDDPDDFAVSDRETVDSVYLEPRPVAFDTPPRLSRCSTVQAPSDENAISFTCDLLDVDLAVGDGSKELLEVSANLCPPSKRRERPVVHDVVRPILIEGIQVLSVECFEERAHQFDWLGLGERRIARGRHGEPYLRRVAYHVSRLS